LNPVLKSSPLHFVFAGGGTAGHLTPGIAVAEQLSRIYPRARITFALTGRNLEVRLVTAAGFEHLVVPSRPMPRSAVEAIEFISASFSGYRIASKFLRSHRIAAVVGLGGYGSVAMAKAAVRNEIPLVLLEQNAMPGRATRWLASSAATVCLAFEEASEHLRDDVPTIISGNPVRVPFAQAAVNHHEIRRIAPRARRLIVLGGSGGSKVLNEQAPRAIYKAKHALEGWQIFHQTGDRNGPAVRELYAKLGIKASVSSFFDDMPKIMAETDLAISRSGGTTLAELAAFAVPALLVPYENAADNHQRLNADIFQKYGAAEVIDPRDVEGRLDDRIAAAVSQLAQRKERRRSMAEAMHELARPNAARLVAKTIRQVAETAELVNVA
jgi:UDP-N-acetylglucosamine--N-acetylmuramyl-(pentapeptide) pyrophosphoryl-undecaprenol N-acetylglucosamine transferase